MNHHHSIILDIETLSRQPNAVITEIGLIAFDRSSFEIVSELAIKPSILEQIALGRHSCPDTIAFHRNNGTLPDFNSETSVEYTVSRLGEFIHHHSPRHIWIQGPDFDRPIIENLCQQAHRSLPWDYWRTRDSRTTWDIAFPGVKHPKRPHSALGDCRATLDCLLQSLHLLGRTHAA